MGLVPLRPRAGERTNNADAVSESLDSGDCRGGFDEIWQTVSGSEGNVGAGDGVVSGE